MNVLIEVLPLALLDTISVSTLVVPLWFLMAPGALRFANVLGYLGLVAVGYLMLGIGLLGGLGAWREQASSALESSTGDLAITVAGIALIVIAAWYGLVPRPSSGDGWLIRWREATVGESATARAVVVVASVAVVLEIATMFPYLVAIDALDRSALSGVEQVLVLGLYCAVMVAPAALLTLARRVAGVAVTPVLSWVNDWIRRNQREDLAWLLAIAGALMLSTTTLFERLTA